jgi:hypothetical protein
MRQVKSEASGKMIKRLKQKGFFLENFKKFFGAV